jgi:hypothetical protein
MEAGGLLEVRPGFFGREGIDLFNAYSVVPAWPH